MPGCELDRGIVNAVNRVFFAKTRRPGGDEHHEAMQELVERIAAEPQIMVVIGKLKETQREINLL
ncbi:hypothetical protein HYU45_01905 [Candidatus Daviesbacteria bacterium]|nr:hypothetical protein [Candidatus Daviesbacteria bacterium]